MLHAGWWLSSRLAAISPGVMANQHFNSRVIWAWSEKLHAWAASCKRAPDRIFWTAFRARASLRQKSGVRPVIFMACRCNVRRLTPKSPAAVAGDVAEAKQRIISEISLDIEAASYANSVSPWMESGRGRSLSI